MQFSVLMSVYKNESVSNFKQAIDSILNQALKPDEIVLMRDGPVPDELQKTIDSYVNDHKDLFSYYPQERNMGLGNALRIGVEKAKYDYIARMDTDDIALPERFAIQVKFMEEHSDVSVCGGQTYEFIGDLSNKTGKREVPLNHEDIVKFMKKRNPFNHMTVMFKKNDVLAVGNYKELHLVEDYYLWLRMWDHGYKFANVPDVLVYARFGDDAYQRRGGKKYFNSWHQIEDYKLMHGLINKKEYYETLAMRFGVQVLMPNKVRGFVLRKFSRK